MVPIIKLDIISGFLGVGKTTLIKKYLEPLANSEEKVVLIENDFGSIGIDKNLFQTGSLDIYEINKGCLCCSLKGTFINTLIEIAKEVKPDRVILEPSGIFILSEIFELFRYMQISDNYEMNSVVTVVDGLHFKEHQAKFGNFLVDQIENAGIIVVSKVESLKEEQILSIVNQLSETFQGREIIAKDWNSLENQEILEIFQGNNAHGKVLLGNTLKNKKRDRTHIGFSSYSFLGETPFTVTALNDKLTALKTKTYGDIIRAKGFVKKEQTNDYLEFHYVDGEIQISDNPKKDLVATFCFIGRDLDKGSLENLFQSIKK